VPNYTPNYHLALPLVNDPTDEDIWGDELNNDMSIIDTVMKTNADAIATIITVPIGSIIDYAGTTAPTNYRFPYGQAISRTTYSVLFGIIGTTYGIGDGTTTFNLPDCRGRLTAGKDDMGGVSANRLTGALTGGVNGDVLGNTGGTEGHTLTLAQIPSHGHSLLSSNISSTTQIAELNSDRGLVGATAGNNGYVSNSADGNAYVNPSGGGDAHNNVQPTIIFNKIIRVL
jgi:microcystin-dependent protein